MTTCTRIPLMKFSTAQRIMVSSGHLMTRPLSGRWVRAVFLGAVACLTTLGVVATEKNTLAIVCDGSEVDGIADSIASFQEFMREGMHLPLVLLFGELGQRPPVSLLELSQSDRMGQSIKFGFVPFECEAVRRANGVHDDDVPRMVSTMASWGFKTEVFEGDMEDSNVVSAWVSSLYNSNNPCSLRSHRLVSSLSFVRERPATDTTSLVDSYFFGVGDGASLRCAADRWSHLAADKVPRKSFGFDSFRGLPVESSHVADKGKWAFGDDSVMSSQGASNPVVTEASVKESLEDAFEAVNVEMALVRGYFTHTFSREAVQQRGMKPALYVDIDVDMHISAQQVLRWMFREKLIRVGTVVAYGDGWCGTQLFEGGMSLAHLEASKEFGVVFELVNPGQTTPIFVVNRLGVARGQHEPGISEHPSACLANPMGVLAQRQQMGQEQLERTEQLALERRIRQRGECRELFGEGSVCGAEERPPRKSAANSHDEL